VFREPLEAQAFAMALALHERGVFTSAIAGVPSFKRKLVAEKGVTTQDTLHRYRDAWDRACDRTPHGEPIELREEDFS